MDRSRPCTTCTASRCRSTKSEALKNDNVDLPKTDDTVDQPKTDEVDLPKTDQEIEVQLKNQTGGTKDTTSKDSTETDSTKTKGKGKGQDDSSEVDQNTADRNKAIDDKLQYKMQKDKFDKQMKVISAEETHAATLQTVGQTIGQLGSTISNAVNSFYQADAKDLEAEGTRDAAEAQTLQAAGDYATSLVQKLEDNAKQIVEFLQTIEQSTSDEMRSIIKG